MYNPDDDNMVDDKPHTQSVQTFDKPTITPVTCNQVMNIVQIEDQQVKLMGTELGLVSMVGKVLEVNESEKALNFIIDDSTETPVKCSVYLEEGVHLQIDQGDYVHIIGRMKNEPGRVFVSKFRVVKDFNEITKHNLAVMEASLHFSSELKFPDENSDFECTESLLQFIKEIVQQNKEVSKDEIVQSFAHKFETPRILKGIQTLIKEKKIFESMDSNTYSLS